MEKAGRAGMPEATRHATQVPVGFSALPIDTLLDKRYMVKEVIAAGGFGITYVAEHVGLRKVCAIKEHFPRMFAALVMVSMSGIAIFLVLSLISHLLLRRWHESAIRREN